MLQSLEKTEGQTVEVEEEVEEGEKEEEEEEVVGEDGEIYDEEDLEEVQYSDPGNTRCQNVKSELI